MAKGPRAKVGNIMTMQVDFQAQAVALVNTFTASDMRTNPHEVAYFIGGRLEALGCEHAQAIDLANQVCGL